MKTKQKLQSILSSRKADKKYKQENAFITNKPGYCLECFIEIQNWTTIIFVSMLFF